VLVDCHAMAARDQAQSAARGRFHRTANGAQSVVRGNPLPVVSDSASRRVWIPPCAIPIFSLWLLCCSRHTPALRRVAQVIVSARRGNFLRQTATHLKCPAASVPQLRRTEIRPVGRGQQLLWTITGTGDLDELHRRLVRAGSLRHGFHRSVSRWEKPTLAAFLTLPWGPVDRARSCHHPADRLNPPRSSKLIRLETTARCVKPASR